MVELSSKAADELYAWSNIALVVGSVIVVVATLLIFYAGKARDHYSELRLSNNETIVAKASKESALADERAAEATLRAAQAMERAAKLENETAELHKQAEEARAESARVNERLRKMQEHRRLTPDQQSALKSFLQSPDFRTDPSIRLQVASVSDAESETYALEFLNLFKACEVNVYPTPGGQLPNECVQSSASVLGLALAVSTFEVTEAMLPLANFTRLLADIGLPLQLEVHPELGEREAMLYVLKKPGVS
jgi:multidrug efflux pump subunit AcrA (membrane-fusion protein)